MFLKNNRELGVKNGTLGTVEAAEADRLTVLLDSDKTGRERITVEAHTYAAVDHGYAVTIHKSQGATVDRAFVLASGGMDRHLTYVAMTRHREQAALYAGCDDFENYKEMAGRVARRRTKETTLDFAERRGIDTLGTGSTRPGTVEPGTGPARAGAARIGERLGLGGGACGRSFGSARGPAGTARANRRSGGEGADGNRPGSKRRLHSRSAPLRRLTLRRGGRPPSRPSPRPCGPRPSAPRTWPKSGTRRSPKSSMTSAGRASKARMVFWLKTCPKTRIKTRQPHGRRSGNGWRGPKPHAATRGDGPRIHRGRVLAGYPARAKSWRRRRIERRHPDLAKTIQAEQEQQSEERQAEIKRRFQKQQERERSRERDGRGR